MQEFIADLSKSLTKGLRAFTQHGQSDLMLDECHNVQIGPAGPMEYEPMRSIGWQVGYFNYLPIRDQSGVLWYWYPVFDGHILVGPNVPSEPTTGLDPIPISNPVDWLEILDENGATWKLYPNIGDGLTRATDSTPLNGIGLSNMIWRGTTSERWMIKFSVAELARYSVRVI